MAALPSSVSAATRASSSDRRATARASVSGFFAGLNTYRPADTLTTGSSPVASNRSEPSFNCRQNPTFGSDRYLTMFSAVIRLWCVNQAVDVRRSLGTFSGDALRHRHPEPGHPVEHRAADPG